MSLERCGDGRHSTLAALESMAIEMPEVNGHPNRMSFQGILTMADVASDKPPAGSRGHRVLLTAAAVEEAIPSLMGMALNYTPSLDGHNARGKIGVITSAELQPHAVRELGSSAGRLRLHTREQPLRIRGYVYAKDFPEVVREMRAKGKSALGMSYEIANVHVADIDAGVWVVTRFTFTGAAVLLRNKAAYGRTWVELA